MDDVITAAKNPSKYMHGIDMHFKVSDITDSPNYYLGNELVQVGNHIHVSSKKYVNEILRKYQKTHGDLKKEVLHMRVKENPELDDSPLLNEKYHKDFQQIIGVCKWLMVVVRFYLSYAVSSLSRFQSAPQVGHIDMYRIIFGYLKKYPKRGYEINPQPLNIDAYYEKVNMKYDIGNDHEYFSEDIYDQFTEPLLDEFDIHVFVDANHGHKKVTGISITVFFSVVGPTPTTLSSKQNTSVQTLTFGTKFTVMNKAADESVMLH